MFQRILLPVDNSRHSDLSLEMALAVAERFDSTVVGFHAYAARLHENRFRQLEPSLPQKYQGPAALDKQRQVHGSLILKGLEIISRAYLEGCAARCRERGVAFQQRVAEGKNYAEIVKEASTGYDLVVMGAKGLGEDRDQPVGSVCLRVARRISEVDTLIVKDGARPEGVIMATLDGSFCSRRGFRLALALARAFDGKVEAVTAYDAEFHSRVFRNMAGVLSDEEGKLFRLQEQESLHQEVIDKGMGSLCQEHVNWAEKMAAQEGVPFQGRVLCGKPATVIAHYARERRPSLLVAGHFGSHHIDGMDLGSTVEALLLAQPPNLLIAADGVRWSRVASEALERVPKGVARELTRQRVEEMAKRQGEGTVTPELIQVKYGQWADGSAKAQSELSWTPEAKERMERVPPFIRGMVVKSIEAYARLKGAIEVTPKLVDEAKAYWESTGTFHL
ncbi:MAG: universal stress protein [Chloroflexi bacterium]|nr:universal stress protein [Chloroflexota bacterium]